MGPSPRRGPLQLSFPCGPCRTPTPMAPRRGLTARSPGSCHSASGAGGWVGAPLWGHGRGRLAAGPTPAPICALQSHQGPSDTIAHGCSELQW